MMFYEIQKRNECLTVLVSEYINLSYLQTYRYWFIPKKLYPDNNIKYAFYYNKQDIQPNEHAHSLINKQIQFLINNQVIIKQPYEHSLCEIFILNPALLLEVL